MSKLSASAGSAGFLTVKEQQTKKDINAFPEGKPKLPTLAELDDMDGRAGAGVSDPSDASARFDRGIGRWPSAAAGPRARRRPR